VSNIIAWLDRVRVKKAVQTVRAQIVAQFPRKLNVFPRMGDKEFRHRRSWRVQRKDRI
jgi:hypothetical protein